MPAARVMLIVTVPSGWREMTGSIRNLSPHFPVLTSPGLYEYSWKLHQIDGAPLLIRTLLVNSKPLFPNVFDGVTCKIRVAIGRPLRLLSSTLAIIAAGEFSCVTLQAQGLSAISAGSTHSLFLKTDGSVWSTGMNTSGALGDGTTTNRSTPVQVMTGVTAVSAGQVVSLFLKADGSAWAAGSNTRGMLGDGTTTNRSIPVQVISGIAAISTGYFHSLFVKTDGTVWAAGWNNYGQLGDGTTIQRNSPVQVMTGVAAVSAGQYHTLFLKTDGSVWAAGYNSNGQLGDGTTTNRITPVQVMTGATAISAGYAQSLFLKTTQQFGRRDGIMLANSATAPPFSARRPFK